MELMPAGRHKIAQLIKKGVNIPNPLTLDIGEEVRVENISGEGVTIYPGCRIYGGNTVICAGAKIGYEGPATVDDCQVGPQVELRGGYFSRSVFLDKSSMGLGAHVREGCILEEQASGAHCVGLKQSILFPFVTLGSLINFCDCLMAGGTSRKDHSEVGSSYIHFNFTPDGDKATPSLIGDVPRGVMLNRPAIFLGGQGGMVGPLRLGYGNVVAAGTILRKDMAKDGKLITARSSSGVVVEHVPGAYPALNRIVGNNILYLANLAALEQWYIHGRRPFFMTQKLGDLVYTGCLRVLKLARGERIKRLQALADKVREAVREGRGAGRDQGGRMEFTSKIDELTGFLEGDGGVSGTGELRDAFLREFRKWRNDRGTDYLDTIRGLPPAIAAKGTAWLQGVVNTASRGAGAILPAMNLFAGE